ncbi:MAG: hypothetical protein K0Q57_614 [Gammaproteobacteria bacterium]|jgi:cell division septation protein DedD|nr:hypothetical protein [Gammaproteobacteria bacterium]
MRKILINIALFMLAVQAYAGFLPDEPPVPAVPNTQQASSNTSAPFGATDRPEANASVISIPSTPSAAPNQAAILRKGGLPAYWQNQAGQTVVLVGPELDKTKLLQQQKIVLELLNTPGTIVSYQVMN